jgi:hypothetical protein
MISLLAGAAQLIVAGAGIFYPEWIATAWQTCMFTLILKFPSHTNLDLIFLAVITVSSIFCIFFNRILPLIDVRISLTLRKISR